MNDEDPIKQMQAQAERTRLDLHEGEKHVEYGGQTWVACAECGVLKRNRWGSATWIHGDSCSYKYRPTIPRLQQDDAERS